MARPKKAIENVNVAVEPAIARKVLDHPLLNDWVPEESDMVFSYQDDVVKARFSDILGKTYESFETFVIVKKHYKERMMDVVRHTNYFIKYYDTNNEFFVDMLSVKYLIDTHPDMKIKRFKNIIISNIIRPSFVKNMKRMAYDLYTININTDKEGKYKSTPKITNEQAKILLAFSFAIRAILPLCVHFSNINTNIVMNKDYIACFDKIFMDIMGEFERDDCPVFVPLCRFVKYRLDRSFNADAPIWEKKKQLYGITYESVFQNLIHEVILVKSLYKIEYDRSVVSYIDGVFTNSYNHFRFENFKFKPVEIEADSGGGDNDDYLSHSESIEMSIYRIDESNPLVNDVNNRRVLDDIYERFGIEITEEEFNFYRTNCTINSLTQKLLHAFYSNRFKNSNAIYTITKEDTIKLLIIMKKYLQLMGMSIMPQICTATVRGKFKENMIKNSKFLEKLETSTVFQEVIKSKFKYIEALDPKDNPVYKILSTIINSTFDLVDLDPDINGEALEDIPVDQMIYEYLTFLSII